MDVGEKNIGFGFIWFGFENLFYLKGVNER